MKTEYLLQMKLRGRASEVEEGKITIKRKGPLVKGEYHK
jgi:hypothetical protein